MRFSRRGKSRRPIVPTEFATTGEETDELESVEVEERSEPVDTELESDVAQPAEAEPPVSGDPTQQLLTALGRFQRQLTDAPTTADGKIWADECMDQLITAVDIAIGQSWSAMVEALTDTGRILQTYQNADRASDCIPFLNDAYEVLCLFVGDLIVDNESSAISENWRRLFDGAVRAVEATGLTLVSDDDDGMGGSASVSGPPAVEDVDGIMLPEEPAAEADGIDDIGIIDNSIDLQDTAASETEGVEELPALDELPPLEDVLEKGVDAPTETEVPELISTDEPMELDLLSAGDGLEDAGASGETQVYDLGDLSEPEGLEVLTDLGEDADASGETPGIEDIGLESNTSAASSESLDEVVTPSPSESRIVEILDTLCEHLAGIQDNTGDERTLAIERFEDGVKALAREADESSHEIAGRLCSLMSRSIGLAKGADGSLDDRAIDLGYAFCGVYMEATSSGGNDDVAGWQRECQDLIAGLEAATGSAPVQDPLAIDDYQADGIVTTIEIDVEPDVSGPVAEEPASAPVDPLAQDAAATEPAEGTRTNVIDLDAQVGEDAVESSVTDIGDPAPPQITIEELQEAVERADAKVRAPEAPTPEAETQAKDEPMAPAEISAPTEAETVAAPPAASEVAQPPAPEQKAAVPTDEKARAPEQAADSATPAEAPGAEAAAPQEDTEYAALLASAGRAAATGDTAGAKYYALQAAAYVSRAELAKAAEKLSETERRLKESWDMTEDARNEVEKVEGDVRRAATEVVTTEQSMGEEREKVAQVAQEVDDVQGEIDDLDRQISELRARRDERAECLDEASARLKEAEEASRSSEDLLDAVKKREQEARAFLESCRRNVKEKQRLTADMETKMAAAREVLAHRQQSCEEIEETIKQICGDDVPPEKPDSMLF